MARTHVQIITDAGGPAALHDRLGYRGKYETVGSWAKRKRIPATAWPELALAGVADLTELALGQPPRQQRKAA